MRASNSELRFIIFEDMVNRASGVSFLFNIRTVK
jgi:hypothetical protein